MADVRVTVYIPCRNYGRYLPQAIESVIGQIFPAWELFLIDEASTDDSLEIMERFRAAHPDRIEVIRHNEPLGLQRTANEVLARASGEFFVRLDADDWFDEGAMQLMVARLDRDPELGLVYGNYFLTDADGHLLGLERRPALDVEDASGSRPPHGACTMVRTRVIKALGGYSENIDAQDGWELWFRIARHVGAASISTPLFYYRQHGQSLSRDNARLLRARASIFDRLASQQAGGYEPCVLAVLGVRESYPGIDGVPFRVYEGESLLKRALRRTQAARRVTHVMVSSRSQGVLDHAAELEQTGAVQPHLRELRSSQEGDRELPVQQILTSAGRSFEAAHGRHPDMLVFCSIHSVNRTPDQLDKVVNVLRVTQVDSVVSVHEERGVVFAQGGTGLELLNPGRLSGVQFERERLFRFNGALIGVWWNVLGAGSLFGERIGSVEMTDHDSARVHFSTETYVDVAAGR